MKPSRRKNKLLTGFGICTEPGAFCSPASLRNMKITRIERQKKDLSRYSIFSERGFEKGISEDTLTKFGLRAGDEIDGKKLEEIFLHDEFVCSRRDAYEYIAYKPRTVLEVRKKLRSRKYGEDAVEKTLNLLKEQRYLDDRLYAENYIAGKLRMKPVGRELLRRKLLQKGIDREVCDEIFERVIPEGSEENSAAAALDKYAPKVKDKELSKIKAKFFRHLIARGFGADIAAEAAEKFIKERICPVKPGKVN